MAFEIKNMSAVAYANGQHVWFYRHDSDAHSVIAAAGYFLNAKKMVSKGDIIMAVSGATPALKLYVVTAVSDTAVTVAAQTTT